MFDKHAGVAETVGFPEANERFAIVGTGRTEGGTAGETEGIWILCGAVAVFVPAKCAVREMDFDAEILENRRVLGNIKGMTTRLCHAFWIA